MTLVMMLLSGLAVTAATLDERPAGDGEWGYRPAAGEVLDLNPPGFSWRPTPDMAGYELEVGQGAGFEAIAYRADVAQFNVHCPPRVLAPGAYVWRYRGVGKDGERTAWSEVRPFTIAEGAAEMPLPSRDELLSRVPQEHPRLFVRPEQMPRLRDLAAGEMQAQFAAMQQKCDDLLVKPPPTAEPPKYPEGMKSGSDEWRAIWWGNRTYTQAVLGNAAELAFCWRLGGKEAYGQLARRLLMDAVAWDPKGATGYRYNDEAGMPYNWGVARTYTFVHPLLSEAERDTCRRVMKIRGDEMYAHLYPRHMWQPYSSHSNRAWHKLGEIGLAFLGEIDGAEQWVWFAANIFRNVYPVWSDDDGGWHEGASYWSSYLDRFSWWADIQKAAFGIDAYDKPYFSKIGDYPLYLMPPGMVGGGFGDLNAGRKSANNVGLMATFAAQAQNPYWQWYVEAHGGGGARGGYVGFVRGALPPVESRPPTDLPTSKVFRGTGQAYLNSSLLDATRSVQVNFKSSPFGTQSHGYDANNSFLLWAYGQRLLVSSGYRDSYGSEHHRQWMWSTRSGNCITVDGQGQRPHSAATKGQIAQWSIGQRIDIVVGQAGDCYVTTPTTEERERGVQPRRLLDRFTRTVIFCKPDLVVIYDRLAAPQPATFEYWLHALHEIADDDQHSLQVKEGDVVCDIDFLTPAGLTFTQTNEYDPNPRPRIKLREWHLTATTAEKRQTLEFVTVYLPRREADPALPKPTLEQVAGGYVLRGKLRGGEVMMNLPTSDTGEIVVQLADGGQVAETARVPAR